MQLVVKNFERPDQRPTLPKSVADIVHLGDTTVVRGHIEPGWRWSNDWQPILQTTSCEMPHTGVVLSGRLHFEMDDGTSADLGPGDAYSVPPGHDAWVVGDAPVQTLDWVVGHEETTERAIREGTAGQTPRPQSER